MGIVGPKLYCTETFCVSCAMGRHRLHCGSLQRELRERFLLELLLRRFGQAHLKPAMQPLVLDSHVAQHVRNLERGVVLTVAPLGVLLARLGARDRFGLELGGLLLLRRRDLRLHRRELLRLKLLDLLRLGVLGLREVLRRLRALLLQLLLTLVDPHALDGLVLAALRRGGLGQHVGLEHVLRLLERLHGRILHIGLVLDRLHQLPAALDRRRRGLLLMACLRVQHRVGQLQRRRGCRLGHGLRSSKRVGRGQVLSERQERPRVSTR